MLRGFELKDPVASLKQVVGLDVVGDLGWGGGGFGVGWWGGGGDMRKKQK